MRQKLFLLKHQSLGRLPSRSGDLMRGGDLMRFHALEDSEFLVLGGAPLNEPLVSYGPFVMNSQDQINACIRNYRAGKMGQL